MVVGLMIMPRQDTDLLQMRNLLRRTEKHVMEFIEYVPVADRHLKVQSPVIFNIIMETGPQLEPMMAKLIEKIAPQTVTADFDKCFKILNKKGMLAIQKVMTREGGLALKPFTNSNPIWWQAYNSHAKHKLPLGIEKATFEN